MRAWRSTVGLPEESGSVGDHSSGRVSNAAENLPFVSIAIIAYNKRSTVDQCLRSIGELDYPREKFEVVVVDGGSTDGTLELLRRYPVRLVSEKRKCRGIARNAAVKNCRGQIIAFTDADCLLSKTWVKDHVSLHNEPKVLAVAGAVLQGGDFSLPARLYHGTYFATQSPLMPRKRTWEIATCNASFKRSAFDMAGLFEELDRGEESLLCWRILQLGFDVLFDPSPKVVHVHDPMGFRTLFRRSWEEGFSDRLLQETFGVISPYRLPKGFLPTAVWIVPLLLSRLGRYLQKLLLASHRKGEALLSIPILFAASVYWVHGYLVSAHHAGIDKVGL